MWPTLASSLPHWYVLSKTNSILSVGAIAMSQKAEMASRPRWPLPSGSKWDGPMGSSTMASSANTASQASLSRAATASRERLPARCAGVSAMSVLPSRVNVGVREALQRVLLLVQRRVGPEPVQEPRDRDVVGDPDLGKLTMSVHAELVYAYRLDLERQVRAAIFGAQLA